MNVLETITKRASGLYSLPEVAVQVLKLTENKKVDTRALKECIERDPALVVKVLKVVNSSLFGLQSEVVDLNQALALLGSNTLKLLVLGFSLPDALFAEVAAEQLSRYWTTALTRAVAARELAQVVTKQDGGEAFIAGLLQDVGQLVLLKELGEPYAKLLDGVWKEQSDLKTVEQAAIGFDHRQLTIALLKQWGLPQSISEAITTERNAAGRVRADRPNSTLAQVIHLTELVVKLVAQNRLAVLPSLLEIGEAYFGMTREQLEEIIVRMEPNVQSLAEGLSIQLSNELDFSEIINKAHRQLSLAAEEASIPSSKWESAEETSDAALLQEVEALADASRSFLKQPSKNDSKNLRFHAAKDKKVVDSSSDLSPQERQMQTLVAVLETALASARAKRESISLVLLRSPQSKKCVGWLPRKRAPYTRSRFARTRRCITSPFCWNVHGEHSSRPRPKSSGAHC